MQTVPQPENQASRRAKQEEDRRERDRVGALTRAQRRARHGFQWALLAAVAGSIWLFVLPFVGMSVAKSHAWGRVAWMVAVGLLILGAFVGGWVTWRRGRREEDSLQQDPAPPLASRRARIALVFAVVTLFGAMFALGAHGWNLLAVLVVLLAGPLAVVLGIGALADQRGTATGSARWMAALALTLAASSMVIAFLWLFNA